MRKYLLHVLIISFVFFLSPALQAASDEEEEKYRLLVIPLTAQKGIDQKDAILLTDILSIELHRSGKFTILNREDMKALLNEKEFELAMGCDDNICLLENVAKLKVNKIIAGNIGKLGTKYIVTIRMINEDGENEAMEKEICDCTISDLDKTVEQVAYNFLKYMGGDVAQDSSIREDSKHKAAKINLRSSYKELSVSDVKSLPNITIRSETDWGFYGHSTIKHNYEMRFINRDKVVLDHATGLMWHQNGSKEQIPWKLVQKWIKKLNKRGYAGYHDWRLPTVEEATSLLESSKNKNGLYIDLTFSIRQECIWTGDKKDNLEGAWLVLFRYGHVYHPRSVSNWKYIRPVRRMK